MFDSFKAGFNKARDLFKGMFAAFGSKTPSRNEMRLEAEEWAVKQKLGKAFFTKQLNPNTRVARIASLSDVETEMARNRGWIR